MRWQIREIIQLLQTILCDLRVNTIANVYNCMCYNECIGFEVKLS